METKLRRWAERNGRTVEWGNLVLGHRGQEFRETFATEEQAAERERQALACEPIGVTREPVAVRRESLR